MKDNCINNQSAFLHIRRLGRIMTKYLDKVLYCNKFTINSLQFHLLSAISKNTKKGVNTISDELGMDRTTLSRNIVPLMRDGYVKDISNKSENKRVTIFCATEKGEEIIKKALPIIEEENNEFLIEAAKILCDNHKGDWKECQFIKDTKNYEDIILCFMEKNFTEII